MRTQVAGADHLDAIAVSTINRPAIREVIPRGPDSALRWHVHGYPDPIAKWNYHPEYEVHLIQRSTGRWIIGDMVGSFSPGQLVLVGPNLPHHWISDLEDGEHIEGRDAVLQFRSEWIEQCQAAIPELRAADPLLRRARHGIEFSGRTAELGAAALLEIGTSTGTARALSFLHLLHVLTVAPPENYRLLVRSWAPQIDDPDAAEVIGRAIDYIFDNIADEVRLSSAAKRAGMSESAFSRYFKAASGQTFTEMVRKLRLTQACGLLERTKTPISAIAAEVGYGNLSNFNRQFVTAYGMTPRQYRAESSRRRSESAIRTQEPIAEG